MTYKERITALCKECGDSEVCGYYLRSLQDKCEYLQAVGYGWELGQQDTLDAVEDYVDRGNSTFTEEFMSGLKQHLEENGSRKSI